MAASLGKMPTTSVLRLISAFRRSRGLVAVIVWNVLHDDEDFAWNRPALTAMKRRRLELQAGLPARKGSKKGIAADYSLKHIRDRERAMAQQAERGYARMVAHWQTQPKVKGTGAAKPTRNP
jgi:transposase